MLELSSLIFLLIPIFFLFSKDRKQKEKIPFDILSDRFFKNQ